MEKMRMNHKKTAKYLAIFPAMLVLLTLASAYASDHDFPVHPFSPFAKAYLAQISATGTLTLKNFTDNPFDITIDTSFNSTVPSIIQPGEYDNIGFHGYAIAMGEYGNKVPMLRFDGLMVVNNSNFFVAFAVQKPQEISNGRYSANGEIDLNITQITLPPAEISMVLMKGNVTDFGEQDAFGFLEANAKIGAENHTSVHTTFTLQPPPRNEEDTEEGPENFTKSYYSVTLANVTKTEVDYDGNALYVEGLWNVYNRTVTVTRFDHDGTTVINIHTVLEGAPGKFNVTLTALTSSSETENRWKNRGNFTLDIEGLDIIKGNVIYYQTKFSRPHENGIPRCDFNEDHVVNILDIHQVARAFGEKLGMTRYDPDADSNSDFVVNILDVFTVAKEYGQEY
jgi:hypothetical protein